MPCATPAWIDQPSLNKGEYPSASLASSKLLPWIVPTCAARAAAIARRFAPPAKLHAIDCYMVVRPGPEGVTMRVSMFMERLGKPAGVRRDRVP